MLSPRPECYKVRYVGREDLHLDAGEFPDARVYSVEVAPILELTTPLVLAEITARYRLYISGDPEAIPLVLEKDLPVGCLTIELSRHVGACPRVENAQHPIESMLAAGL